MQMEDYQAFLASKRLTIQPLGISVDPDAIHPSLFPFQRELVRWAVRKGRAALFCDTGLGKTRLQVEWARLLGRRTLIFAPLSVARQTVAEAAKIGVTVRYVRSQDECTDPTGIYITNYELLAHFEAGAFDAVVLDESSILKGLDGKTRARLTAMWAETPYRLCCTATPAPNDISEIANHAEFLGVMTRAEMLATFFIHDDTGWRLKGHAEQPFYRWLASWGMAVRKPSDLGFEDTGYNLPALDVAPVWVETAYQPEDTLFFMGLHGIGDRVKVRKATMTERVQAAADLVNRTPGQWIVWCGFNDEGDALTQAIPDAVQVAGKDTPEYKTTTFEAFQDGAIRVLVTKTDIAGFGLNFQQCHQMAFVGLSDSWEAYYQAIRRCYRFGQAHPVTVRIVLSEAEDAIYQNVLHKEQEALHMSEQLVAHVRQFEQAEITAATEEWEYSTDEVTTPDYRLLLGDSSERLAEVADNSIDLSVYSPPFGSLYTYSPTERDLGNCRTPDEFTTHYGYIVRELLRVHKPGRLTCVHVAQIPAMLARDGYIGLKDFRGDVIRLYTEQGWIYHGEVCIDKDPQAQAIRTKSKGLLFVQMHKDSSWSRPALADYILVFRKPGENAVPINPDLTNDEWISWARPIWYGIRESDTLQYQTAREDADERHICPLQLGTIERCIRLWSNPGETVLTPFLGIGSEAYQAVKLGRKAVGVELKRSYWRAAVRNVAAAVAERDQPNFLSLFDQEVPA